MEENPTNQEDHNIPGNKENATVSPETPVPNDEVAPTNDTADIENDASPEEVAQPDPVTADSQPAATCAQDSDEAVAPDKKQDSSAGSRTTAASPSTAAKQPEKPKSSGKAPSNRTLRYILVGAIAAVLLVVLFFVLFSKPSINLNKYLHISVDGYNGYGTVTAEFDWDQLREDHQDDVKLSKTMENRLEEITSGETEGLADLIRDSVQPIDILEELVQFTMDTSGYVSNGDEIPYQFTVNESTKNILDVKLKYHDGTYKVSGLPEAETFDSFAGVRVAFSGVAPEGHASVLYEGNVLNETDFVLRKDSGLSDGDVITVTMSGSPGSYVDRIGKLPQQMSKEFTVSGLDTYLAHFSDLPDQFVQTVQKDAQDVIYAAMSRHNGESKINNLTYAGYTLCSKKESVTSEYYNLLYIIFSGDVENYSEQWHSATVYFPVLFRNIVLSAIGLSYSEAGIPVNQSDDLIGFINPLQAYSQIVTQNEDAYTVDTGGGFEVFQTHDSISKLEDIDQAYKDGLIASANDFIQSYIATEREDYANNKNKGKKFNITVSDPAFVGEYFLTAKQQTDDYTSNNAYILVYSTTVTNVDGVFDPQTVYLPVEYDGIVALPNNRYICLGQLKLLGEYTEIYPSLTVFGYIDGAKMFNDCITTRRDQYNYQVSEGLKPFGE